MRRTIATAAATLLLGACAVIPPNSTYVSCAGSESYKVCKRIKNCPGGGAVFTADHIRHGKLMKTVEADCPED